LAETADAGESKETRVPLLSPVLVVRGECVSQSEELATKMQELDHEPGFRPDLDLVARLFRPEAPHEIPANEDEYNVSSIKVQGVLVRYDVPNNYPNMMTAEGTSLQTSQGH
jgi:hypothetical protein